MSRAIKLLVGREGYKAWAPLEESAVFPNNLTRRVWVVPMVLNIFFRHSHKSVDNASDME